MTYNPKWLENSPDGQLGGYDGATGVDTLVPTQKAVKSFIYELTGDVKDPSGIANRSATSLTYDTTSTPDQCTVHIGPDTEDVEVYILGKKYIFSTTQSVTLADTEGTHYVYFNTSGTLVETAVFDKRIITEWAYVAAVYWDATNKEVVYFGDERHGINMAGETHYNLHNSQGTAYITGLALGDIIADSTSAIDADAQFSVTSGTILDEDISTEIDAISAPAAIPVLYLTGASAYSRLSTVTNFPVINTVGTGRVAYNQFTGGAWQLTEATDGYFVLAHIFATNDIDNPVIAVAGQAEYATLSAARDGAETEINSVVKGDLPFQEFLAIATIIFETNDTFGNTPKAVIRSTNSGGDYQDWRLSALTPTAGSPADHGQLSGLADDDHVQYAILSGIRAFTGEQEFAAGIDISAGDLTVASGTNVVVGATNVANFTADAQQLGVSGDTLITTTQSTDVIDFTVAGGSVGTFESDGLTLANGTNVNEFSTDGTLAGDSDNAVPTEQAVKTYVDTAIGNFSSNRIYQGDSQVIVNDATAAGEIRVIADNTEIASFLATSVKLGDAVDANGANLTVSPASGISMQEQDVQYFAAQGAEIIVGRSADGLYFDLLNDLATMTTGGAITSIWTSDTQIFGLPQVIGPYPGGAGAGVTVEQGATPSVTIHASEDNYLTISDSTGSTPTNPEPSTLRYYDQGAEFVRVNSVQMLVGDLDNNINGQYFGIDIDTYGPSSGLIYEENTNNYMSVQAVNQRFGDSSGPHALMYSGETFPAAIYTDGNENVGLQLSNTNLLIGQNNNTRVNVNLTTDDITFYSTTTAVGTFDATGLSLQNGTNINEFSTDVNLGGGSPSNDAVPTEAAVKTYVDNAIGGAVDHNSTTGKQGGDSTANEFYHVSQAVYDGIYTDGGVIGLGDQAATNIETDSTANVVAADINGTEVFNLSETTQTLGVSGDTYVQTDQTNDQVSITAGNESQILVETTGTTVYDDLTITGNLFVDGTTFVVNNQEVTTADNIIVVNNGEVGPGVTAGSAGIEVDRGSETNYQFLFVEASDTFRIGEVGSLQAVATREDAPTDTRVPWWNDTAKRFDTAGNDYITVNTSTHVISFGITSEQGKFDTNGLTLSTGASVNEFSTDGTLSGDSNDAVPTENAVKTYVDNAIAGFAANKIEDGDSYVLVNDSTGGAGEVKIVVDGVEVGYYDALSSSQRLGKTTGGNIVTSDTAVTAVDNSVVVFYLSETLQRFGVNNATSFTMDQTADTHAFTANGASVLSMSETQQVVGDSTTSSSIILNQTADTVTIQNNVTATAVFAETSQTIGQSGDSRIVVSQSADTVSIYAAASLAGAFGTSGLTLASGATVNEFSTDTALGTSDTVVPTQNAVKTYVDNAIGGTETVRFVNSDTTAVAGDIVLVDSTAGPVNVELLESEDGKITVKKITNDSNTVTIFTSPGLIDGQANITIDTPYQAYGFISDASNFYII